MLKIPASASADSLCSPEHTASKPSSLLSSASGSPNQQRKLEDDDYCSTTARSSTLETDLNPNSNPSRERLLQGPALLEQPAGELATTDSASDLTQHTPLSSCDISRANISINNTQYQQTPTVFNTNSVNGDSTLGSFFGNPRALSSPSCSRIGLRSTSTSTILLSNNSMTATETVAGADGNFSVHRQQSAHQQNSLQFSRSIAGNNTQSNNSGSVFRPILSLLVVATLPLNTGSDSTIQLGGNQALSLSTSCSNDDLPSPSCVSLQPLNGPSTGQEEDAKFEFCVQGASIAESPDVAHGFDQSMLTEDHMALGVEVSSLHSFLETPKLPDEHDYGIHTPLLDLQEQGYAMASPGKTIVPREFEERLAIITENLMQISLEDDTPFEDACPSSPLDARYLERSPSHPDMLSHDFADQEILKSDEQEEIYLVWLLQWDVIEAEDLAFTKAEEVMAVSRVINMDELLGQCLFISNDVSPILEGQPLTHGLVLKKVRFDPHVHIITSNLVRHGGELESASSGGTCSPPIPDLRLCLASLPQLPDSSVHESSPYFVKAKYHYLLPALPLTPVMESESVFSTLATIDSLSPSHQEDVVDLSMLPPLPLSPEIEYVDTFSSKDPSSDTLPIQGMNTNTDSHLSLPSANLHKPEVMSLQLDTALRHNLSDESASLRLWTMLKNPVLTRTHASATSSSTPVSPRTIELAATRQQLFYWTQTASKLRDQELTLKACIDTLIAEMAELIDRCEASEMALHATKAEVHELQRKLAEVKTEWYSTFGVGFLCFNKPNMSCVCLFVVQEQEFGFASIQEAALSIQENHLIGIALEETWKELDLMRGMWVDLQQKKVEHEATCRALQERQPLLRAASLAMAPCSQAENSSIVGLGALADTLSRHSVSDTHKTEDVLSTLKFVTVSLMLTTAMTACLLILLGDQNTLCHAGGTFVVMRRTFEPVAYRYLLLAKEEIFEHWGELSQAVEHAKTSVVAPVLHAIAAWSGMMEYREEMWILLTASSSRNILLR